MRLIQQEGAGLACIAAGEFVLTDCGLIAD